METVQKIMMVFFNLETVIVKQMSLAGPVVCVLLVTTIFQQKIQMVVRVCKNAPSTVIIFVLVDFLFPLSPFSLTRS